MKNLNKTIICLLLVLLLTSLNINYISGSDPISLSSSENNLIFTLKEDESASRKINLNNLSNEDIYFSTYKINQTEIPSNLETEISEEELGSYWLTCKYNFQRSGYNDIESSEPPYIYKWKYESDKIFHSPVLRGGNLYIPSEDGNIYLIDSRTGIFKERFSFSSPILSLNMSGKYIIVITKEKMNVFDRSSKLFLWEYPNDNTDDFACCALDNSIYLATGDNIISFEALTGSIRWKRSGSYITASSWKDKIITTSSNNVLSLFNSQNGDSYFELKLSGEIVGVPTIQDNLIYLTTLIQSENSYSRITCFDFKSNIQWSYDFSDIITASQSISKDYLLSGTSRGIVYSMNRFNGSIIWKYNTKSPIHISPSIASDIVYIGCNDGSIYGLDLLSGNEIWKNNVNFPFYSEIIIAQGFFYTTDNKGALIAWGREWENVIPPMSPEGLKGFPGNGYSTLCWRVSTYEQDLEGYNIYRRGPYESEFSFIKKLKIINNYQDTEIINDNTYYYIVRAYDSHGNESASSTQATVTPSEKAEPVWMIHEPTQGMVKKGSSIDINIKVDALKVIPGLYSGSIFIVHSGDLKETEPIEIKVSANITKLEYVKPQTPKISNFEASDTRVILNWERVSNIKSYKIYRSKVSRDEYSVIAEINSLMTEYIDDSVKNGSKYYYSIRSIDNDNNESNYSEEISATPKPLPITVNIKDNSILNDGIFETSGRADPKAKLQFKDKLINLDSKGYFKLTIGVPVGPSIIVFNAFDTSNASQTLQIKVNYNPPSLKMELKINSENVYMNGKLWPYPLDVPPLIKENRTFIPLRFLSETIGAKVEWFADEKKIVYTRNDVKVELWINQKIVRINGKNTTIDAAPFISNGRTLVPLRFISEPLGANIDWNSITQVITLNFEF